MKIAKRIGLIVIAGVLLAGTIVSLPSHATVPGINAGIDTSTSGGNPDGKSYYSQVDISQDGRYIVFNSQASNLVLNSTPFPGTNRLFVRDRLTNSTELVSQSTSGAASYGENGRISEDGRYIVFSSFASDLVSGDTNGKGDIFIRDRKLGTTTRVSSTLTGTQTTFGNAAPDVSADGQYVVWTARPDIYSEIYLKNMSTGTVTQLSQNSSGAPANSDSNDPRISCEGRIVVFKSNANNLTTGDTSNPSKTYWRTYIIDMLKPLNPQYIRGGNFGVDNNPSVSCNGNYIAFSSSSKYLVPGDTNNKEDAFLYDRVNDSVQRVSVDSSGAQTNDSAFLPSSSNDGKYVVFISGATNLISSDTNGKKDVFIRNILTNTTEVITRNSSGSLANGDTSWSTISSDGRYVIHTSDFSNPSTNLISGYTGNVYASKSGADYDY